MLRKSSLSYGKRKSIKRKNKTMIKYKSKKKIKKKRNITPSKKKKNYNKELNDYYRN